MGDYQGGEVQALPLGRARGFIPRAKSNRLMIKFFFEEKLNDRYY